MHSVHLRLQLHGHHSLQTDAIIWHKPQYGGSWVGCECFKYRNSVDLSQFIWDTWWFKSHNTLQLIKMRLCSALSTISVELTHAHKKQLETHKDLFVQFKGRWEWMRFDFCRFFVSLILLFSLIHCRNGRERERCFGSGYLSPSFHPWTYWSVFKSRGEGYQVPEQKRLRSTSQWPLPSGHTRQYQGVPWPAERFNIFSMYWVCYVTPIRTWSPNHLNWFLSMWRLCSYVLF